VKELPRVAERLAFIYVVSVLAERPWLTNKKVQQMLDTEGPILGHRSRSVKYLTPPARRLIGIPTILSQRRTSIGPRWPWDEHLPITLCTKQRAAISKLLKVTQLQHPQRLIGNWRQTPEECALLARYTARFVRLLNGDLNKHWCGRHFLSEDADIVVEPVKLAPVVKAVKPVKPVKPVRRITADEMLIFLVGRLVRHPWLSNDALQALLDNHCQREGLRRLVVVPMCHPARALLGISVAMGQRVPKNPEERLITLVPAQRETIAGILGIPHMLGPLHAHAQHQIPSTAEHRELALAAARFQRLVAGTLETTWTGTTLLTRRQRAIAEKRQEANQTPAEVTEAVLKAAAEAGAAAGAAAAAEAAVLKAEAKAREEKAKVQQAKAELAAEKAKTLRDWKARKAERGWQTQQEAEAAKTAATLQLSHGADGYAKLREHLRDVQAQMKALGIPEITVFPDEILVKKPVITTTYETIKL
jgi:hypothetical protein